MIKRLLLLFAFIALMTIILASHQSNYENGAEVNSFQECLIAGYEIIETYPEQCVTPNGDTFIGPQY